MHQAFPDRFYWHLAFMLPLFALLFAFFVLAAYANVTRIITSLACTIIAVGIVALAAAMLQINGLDHILTGLREMRNAGPIFGDVVTAGYVVVALFPLWGTFVYHISKPRPQFN